MTTVPFRWRTGTNPDGQHILICDRGGTPDSPQPNDTWTITLEPPDFKYDDQARETLAAMVETWHDNDRLIDQLVERGVLEPVTLPHGNHSTRTYQRKTP